MFCKLLKELILKENLKITHIISGAASKGADALAIRWANENQIGLTKVPADWDKYGKSAGMIRNSVMIEMEPDAVIAYWDGTSSGTSNTIERAKDKNIDVYIYKTSS